MLCWVFFFEEFFCIWYKIDYFFVNFFLVIIIFGVSGFVMVVVSLFIKKVFWDEFGGLIWVIINDLFILYGVIGEEDECERVENGGIWIVGNFEGIEFLSKGKIL